MSTLTCAHCGKSLHPENRFCTGCGHAVPAAQHRPVTAPDIESAAQSRKRRRLRMAVIAAAVVLAVAGAGLIAWPRIYVRYFVSPETMFSRGENFYHGTYSPRDLAQAVQWYRAAAERGHAGAQFMVGMMYRTGEGLPQDEGAAVAWFQRAARQNHAQAQAELRRMGIGW